MPFTVKLMRNPIGVEFEVGSVAEALGILESNKDKFAELLAFSDDLGGNDDETVTTAMTPAVVAEPAKRGRKPKNQPDAATATAPAPMPVPDAAPLTPPVASAAVDTSIPAFLDRRATVDAPPPPPLMPSAPPVAPAAAPTFVLGNKIADDLQKRLDGSADKGAALSAWLMPHVTAITIPTASIDEVIAIMRFTPDEKVVHLAGPLGIS